ncbi:MAG: ATP-binding protein [Myxococcaceae bacterium]
MFQTSSPAVERAFFDRTRELAELTSAVESLRKGAPRWVAVLGSRKVGKTSMLLELTRRARHPKVRFVVLDSFEEQPLSLSIFKTLALRTVDAFFALETGVSFEALAFDPVHYAQALALAQGFERLDRTTQLELARLPQAKNDEALARLALGLPERLAQALGLYCVVAWDEFQELARLDERRGKGVLPLARAVWQRCKRTSFIICGSERTMLEKLVKERSSPFFLHFSVMELSSMARPDAIELIRRSAPPDRPIPEGVANLLAVVLDGQPFYLQIFGEALTQLQPPYDDGTVKEVFSKVLFNRTGRLALYFENEFDRVVGNATTLAAVLEAIADGPKRLSEVARAISAPTGATVRYLERLGDVVRRTDEGVYVMADVVFALWLKWRRPGGTVVPMTVIGNEAEQKVAQRLAELGFELVYQSRASRGAFDLLGVRAGSQVGIQVKRTALPLRFSKPAWQRLEADAARLSWRWLIAAVDPADQQVRFLDPKKARKGRQVTLSEQTAIENLLGWLGQ